MSFGPYFKDLRKSKNKTQEELAEAIGKSKMLISGVETGRNTSFSDEDIDKLIKVMELSDEEGEKLRIEASRASGKIPPITTRYLLNHEDLLIALGNMANRQLDGSQLKKIIECVEEVLYVKNN